MTFGEMIKDQDVSAKSLEINYTNQLMKMKLMPVSTYQIPYGQHPLSPHVNRCWYALSCDA